MVSAVLFDLDCVFVDTEKLSIRASDEVLARHGIERKPEELARVFGRRTIENYRELIESRGLRLDPAELAREKEELYFKMISGRLSPKEGVLELIGELEKAGVRIAVVSSSGIERVKKTLDEIKLSSEFDQIISGDCCRLGKPDPAPFLYAAKKLRVKPEKCVAIEDADAGIAAAKAAGMMVIGVKNKNTHGQTLKGADLVVVELSEVNLTVLNGL